MTERSSRSAIVRRVLPATPEVVYDEWLDADALADFICPFPTTAGTIAWEPQVGGKLQIDMVNAGGVSRITGEFLELDRPNRLRFTWKSDRWSSELGSVVTVTFEARGDEQTLMTIDHAQLPVDQFGDYTEGWTLIAEQLERRLRAVA